MSAIQKQPAKVVGCIGGKWYIWEKQRTPTTYLYGVSKDDKLPPPCDFLLPSTALALKNM
jgi:hypothetical protein